MASKLDFIKVYKEYYTAGKAVSVLEFGTIGYVTIEGVGEPAGESFSNAVEALYPLAYGVKKICKGIGQDFGVPKLEGLWWVDSKKLVSEVPKSEWCWKLMIRMPEFVTKDIFNSAVDDVFKKKKISLVKEIQFEEINENEVMQIMHLGPYATEPETIEKMEQYLVENNYKKNGHHHEIYISDPRKTAPEKMKTILRQPISKK